MRRITAVACGLALTGVAAGQELTTVRIADGLSRPLFITHAPGDAERIFILQQRGEVLVMDLATRSTEVFLDLSHLVSQTGNERGLLGMAFHPDYENNGLFYVDYTLHMPPGESHPSIIAQYSVSADPDRADPDSAVQVLRVEQDFSNHNAGWIAFGPNDGYLYVSFGDGGSGNDPNMRAQNLTQLLGKMLRLDVDGDDFPGDPERNYAIPPDNPFVMDPGARDEIWAYGLRNPFRDSFDRATGDLWIADVGQNSTEEVNFQPASSAGGENYGWRCYEGTRVNITSGDCDPLPAPVVFPIHEYTHDNVHCSVTGGYVYRGCIPGLDGTYFFADFCSSNIWSFRYDGQEVRDFTNRTGELDPGGGMSIEQISSFGEDFFGELYITDLGGEIFKIVSACPADRDGDGDADVNDFFAYLDAFAAGDICADTDGDAQVDVNDFFGYLDLFEAGC